LVCLDNGDIEALESYELELGSDFLYELHGIHDINIYLSKMWLSASSNVNENERGLWGDTFFIRWLEKWLNISIVVWSLTRKTKYFHFNRNANADPNCILFHDANPISGHYNHCFTKN
jgi:hypothetical protein